MGQSEENSQSIFHGGFFHEDMQIMQHQPQAVVGQNSRDIHT